MHLRHLMNPPAKPAGKHPALVFLILLNLNKRSLLRNCSCTKRKQKRAQAHSPPPSLSPSPTLHGIYMQLPLKIGRPYILFCLGQSQTSKAGLVQLVKIKIKVSRGARRNPEGKASRAACVPGSSAVPLHCARTLAHRPPQCWCLRKGGEKRGNVPLFSWIALWSPY